MKRYTIPRTAHCDGGALPMATKFCPNCGTPHECAAEAASEAEKTALAIARVEANRDIEIARLQAGAAKHIADAQAESEADHLEGVIEGVELASGESDGDDVPAGDPIIVQVDAGDDDDTEADVEEPPVVDAIPEPGGKSRDWWAAYR